MADLREQRYAIKFCVRLKKTATETYHELKKAFGDDTMAQRMCYRWHKSFLSGRDSCELQGGDGAPIIALTDIIINTGAFMIRTDSLMMSDSSRTRYNAGYICWKRPHIAKQSFTHV